MANPPPDQTSQSSLAELLARLGYSQPELRERVSALLGTYPRRQLAELAFIGILSGNSIEVLVQDDCSDPMPPRLPIGDARILHDARLAATHRCPDIPEFPGATLCMHPLKTPTGEIYATICMVFEQSRDPNALAQLRMLRRAATTIDGLITLAGDRQLQKTAHFNSHRYWLDVLQPMKQICSSANTPLSLVLITVRNYSQAVPQLGLPQTLLEVARLGFVASSTFSTPSAVIAKYFSHGFGICMPRVDAAQCDALLEEFSNRVEELAAPQDADGPARLDISVVATTISGRDQLDKIKFPRTLLRLTQLARADTTEVGDRIRKPLGEERLLNLAL